MKTETVMAILGDFKTYPDMEFEDALDEADRAVFASGTEARVIELIAKRQQVGISKYGCSVQDNPLVLRQWLQHALEEALDMAVYLQRSIEEIDRNAEDGK